MKTEIVCQHEVHQNWPEYGVRDCGDRELDGKPSHTAEQSLQRTPTLFGYTIGEVVGSNGKQFRFVVGKPGLSQLYYVDTQEEALKKLIELRGIEPVINAVNAHEGLVNTLKDMLHEIDYQHGDCGTDDCRVCRKYQIGEKALAQASGE